MKINQKILPGLAAIVLATATFSAYAGQTSYFIYDESGHVIGEYDANGNPIQEHIYLGDRPVAVVTGGSGSGGTVDYVTTDQLNTPRVVTDGSKAVLWSWNSDPFGNGQPTGSITYNLRFPGQYYDAETGLFQNWNRDYDSLTGRYIEFDPIGLSSGPNGYVYVNENPFADFDPMGLAPRLGSEYRPCDSSDSATCAAQCGSRGVKRCDRLWYLKPVRVRQPGLTLYDWRKGPLSCVCNDPQSSCKRCAATVLTAVVIGFGVLLIPEITVPVCAAAL